jgi:uncharacterized OB-fold protein
VRTAVRETRHYGVSTTEGTPVVHPFVAAATAGVLAIERCDDCDTWRNPPAPMCGHCGSVRSSYQPVSGRGRLVSWMTARHPNRPEEQGRTVILVALDVGVRLVSNLVDDFDGEPIDGMDLVVDFADVDGVVLPVFRPVGAT